MKIETEKRETFSVTTSLSLSTGKNITSSAQFTPALYHLNYGPERNLPLGVQVANLQVFISIDIL
jgi:hypothetical protein